MQIILPITVYRQGPGKRERMQVSSPWLPYTHQSQVSFSPLVTASMSRCRVLRLLVADAAADTLVIDCRRATHGHTNGVRNNYGAPP